MSVEYINRISYKKDGVYVSWKSANDSCPYRSVRLDKISDIYLEQGMIKADIEMAHMFLDYAEPRGSHPSLDRFYRFLHQYPSIVEEMDFYNRRDKIYNDFRKEYPDYDFRKGWFGKWKEQLEVLGNERDEAIGKFFAEYYEKQKSLISAKEL